MSLPSPVPSSRRDRGHSRWAGPALAAALLLPLAGCGGSSTPAAASASSAPASAPATSSAAAPTAPTAPSTAAPSSPSTTVGGPNAAVCAKLQKDALSLAKGGVTKDPKVLAARLEKLAAMWKADAASSKDAKLKASVEKASSALTSAAQSSSSGKKISLQKVQAQLQSAGEGLRASCPKTGTTAGA